jgi:predicted ATPase
LVPARAAAKQGELRLFKGSVDALRGAEECVQQALDWAGCDRTPAWELRAALSLARLRCDQGQQAGGRDRLASVCDRFTEGFGTADLREAKRLIDALS